MEDRPAALEQEVVEQAPVAGKHLCPNAAGARGNVAVGECGEIPAHVCNGGAFDGSAPDLGSSCPPVAAGETPHPGVVEQLLRVAQPDAGPAVALAVE